MLWGEENMFSGNQETEPQPLKPAQAELTSNHLLLTSRSLHRRMVQFLREPLHRSVSPLPRPILPAAPWGT